MKRIILIALVVFAGAMVNKTVAQKATKVICFKSDMDCSDCEKTLTDHLRFEKGVKDLKVDHATNTIFIEYKEGKNSDADFIASIEKKGFKADKISTEEYKEIVSLVKEEGHIHEAEVHRERK